MKLFSVLLLAVSIKPTRLQILPLTGLGNTKLTQKKDFRNSVITETENINTDTETENLNTDATLNFDDDDADHDAGQSLQTVQEATDSSCESVDIETLEHKLASVLLKMQTVLHVSKSAIHDIVEEVHDIFHFSKSLAVESIKNILVKQKIDVDAYVLQEISSAIFETNPLLLTTSEKGSLSTDHRKNLYFKEHFTVIEPTQYLYDRMHKNHFVYVSLYNVLECLLDRTDILDKIVFNQQSTSGHFESFQDGSYFQENRLLGDQDLAISLGLYVDEFEVCNPLGTSRKIHKIVAIYWVVLNLPSQFRSSLHSIQLAVLGKSEDVRFFG